MKKLLTCIMAITLLVTMLFSTAVFAAPEEGAPAVAFDQEVKLTLATTGTAGSVSALMYEEWMDVVTERSNGKITFDYQPAGVLGNEGDCFQQVMDGVIEICVCGLGTFSNFNNLPEVFQLPFLINSYDVELAAIKTPEWRALLDAAEESIGSAYIYGTVEIGMRHIFSKKPIICLDDIKGVKVRTASSNVLMEAFELLGANPIVTDSTEVYSAFSNGVVDALDMNYLFGVLQKHYEVGKEFTEVGIYPFPCFLCFNKTAIDALPEGYWDFMKACMDECVDHYFTETIVTSDDDNKAILEENGVSIHVLDDGDAWREAIQPLYDEYLKEGTDERVISFVEAVEAIKAAK